MKKTSADSLKESFEQEKSTSDVINESTDKSKKSPDQADVSDNKTEQKYDRVSDSSDKIEKTGKISETDPETTIGETKDNFEKQDSASSENRGFSYGKNGSDKAVGLNKDEK
ncbi:MAG: hypothetical protein HQK65_13625 [Desulfamplus sp.]|nr:hypothetical protein [Desulfamplus sp.]